MIRIVLVEWAEGDWRTFRQPQWMAQVRETPDAASRPRLHFDIDENQYALALKSWPGSHTGRDSARALLADRGAVEIHRP